jgi:enoyl-CoA hydratase/carnithine racemase
MTATPLRADGPRDALRVDLAGEPPCGFLSEALVERLLSVAEGDNHARAIIIESRGASFCMGLDPGFLIGDGGETPVEQRARAALERFGRLLRAIECAACPVIAIVNGSAAGGGVALAAAADVIIATSRATFALPETLLGIVPALAFPVLAQRIGAPRARWMAISGVTVDAAEAVRLGIADVVVDDPEVTLGGFLQRLTRLDARSVTAVKRLASVYRAEHPKYESAALNTFGRLLESEETQARLRRFATGLAPWSEDEPA